MPLGHAVGPLIAYGMLAPNTSGLESLAQKQWSGQSVYDVSFAARDALMMLVMWKFDVADRLAARFNGSTANEYWSRVFSAGNVANAALTFTNTEEPGIPHVRFQHNTSTMHAQMIWSVANRAGSPKPSFFQVQRATGTTASVSDLNYGAGQWLAAGDPAITSIRFEGVGGQTFSIYVGVYGRNFP